MNWDLTHRRTSGFIIEVTRFKSVYAIMALHGEHKRLNPVETFRHLQHSNERNEPLVGMRHLTGSATEQRIHALHAEGILTRNGNDYELSAVGSAIINALEPVRHWAPTQWAPLVRATRRQHGLRPDAPIPPPASFPPAHMLRLATGMTLGVLNGRWLFAVLVFAAADLDGRPRGAPCTASELRDTINVFISENADLNGRRYLNDSAHYDALAWLERAGLMSRTAVPQPGRRPRVLFEPTPFGRGLLDALWHAGDACLHLHDELFRILAMRFGWPT